MGQIIGIGVELHERLVAHVAGLVYIALVEPEGEEVVEGVGGEIVVIVGEHVDRCQERTEVAVTYPEHGVFHRFSSEIAGTVKHGTDGLDAGVHTVGPAVKFPFLYYVVTEHLGRRDVRILDGKSRSFLGRALRAYSQALGGRLSYYHDRLGLEADAVLHLDDGRYALIECKLGSREIEDGAKHLLEIKRLIAEKNKKEKQMRLREPDLLIVLTGGEMAYTREDGVKIIPIGCLKD